MRLIGFLSSCQNNNVKKHWKKLLWNTQSTHTNTRFFIKRQVCKGKRAWLLSAKSSKHFEYFHTELLWTSTSSNILFVAASKQCIFLLHNDKKFSCSWNNGAIAKLLYTVFINITLTGRDSSHFTIIFSCQRNSLFSPLTTASLFTVSLKPSGS